MYFVLLLALAYLAYRIYRLHSEVVRIRRAVDTSRSALKEQHQKLLEQVPLSVQRLKSRNLLDPATDEEIDSLLEEIGGGEPAVDSTPQHNGALLRIYARHEQRLLDLLLERLQAGRPLDELEPVLQTHVGRLNELAARLTACRRALRASILIHNRTRTRLFAGLMARYLGYEALEVPEVPEDTTPLMIEERTLRTDLPSTLQPLNRSLNQRITAFRLRVAAASAVAVSGLVAALFSLNDVTLIAGQTLFGLVAAAVGLVLAVQQQMYYQRLLREEVLPVLAAAIDPELAYREAEAVALGDFERSGLYSNINRVSGQCHFYGRVGQTQVEFSFLRAERRHIEHYRDKDGTRRSRERIRTLFNGLFLVADCNKHVRGRTQVRRAGYTPADDDSLQPVPIVDEAFEHHFTVLSADPVEACYLVDREFMQRLLLLRQRLGSFEVAFASERLFLAIQLRQSALAPSLWRPRDAQLRVLWQAVQSLAGIVDDLNLNTRIWSKAGEALIECSAEAHPSGGHPVVASASLGQ